MSEGGARGVEAVEVLSKAPNASIIKLPWRKFPGVAVQGDSLSILADLAQDVAAALAGHPDEEIAGAAEELHAKLAGLLAHYESTLESAGIKLPYSKVSPPG